MTLFGVRCIRLSAAVLRRSSRVHLGSHTSRFQLSLQLAPVHSRSFSSHPGQGIADDAELVTSHTPLDTIRQALDAADKIEYKSLSDLGYSVSDIAIRALDVIHSVTGLPWYATIFVTTLAVRTAMFPLTIKGMRNAEKMKAAQPDLERIQAEYTASPKTPEDGLAYQAKMKDVLRNHDVNPFRGLIAPLSQIPVFLGFFWGLQSIRDYFPDYASGGTLWFPDLSVADPTYVLPVISSMLMVASIETGKDTLPPQWGKNAVLYIRGFGVVLVPFTVHFQAGVLVYWVSSNFYTLIQALVLRQPLVRTALKLAPLDVKSIEMIKEAETVSSSPFSAAVARAQQDVITSSQKNQATITEENKPSTLYTSKATDRTKPRSSRKLR